MGRYAKPFRQLADGVLGAPYVSGPARLRVGHRDYLMVHERLLEATGICLLDASLLVVVVVPNWSCCWLVRDGTRYRASSETRFSGLSIELGSCRGCLWRRYAGVDCSCLSKDR